MSRNKIKVAEIIGNFSSGGVEAVIMNYFRNINKNEFEIHFICDRDSSLFYRDDVERDGGRIIIIDSCKKFKNPELEKVLNENKYDIVHVHMNTLSVFPLRIAKRCGVPVRISHNHSTYGRGEFLRNVAKVMLRPFARRYATCYFAVSAYAGIWLFGKKAFQQGKVIIMNNPVDLRKFQYSESARKTIRDELEISDDTILIGHIGRMVKTKNQKFLINALKDARTKNPNVKMLVVGDGPLLKKLKNYSWKQKVRKYVLFIEPNKNVQGYYSAFDLFALPSLYEGFPMVGLEAQSAGCPCLFSTGVIPEAVFNDNVYLLPIVDHTKWGDVFSIRQDRASPNYDALERFSQNEIIKKLEKLYRMYANKAKQI